MSITKISSTRNAGALIRYILEDEAHNEASERYVSASAHNCTIGNARSEFKAIRKRYNKENNIQAYSIIISWSKEELNPDDEDDIQKAQLSADMLAKEIGGENRQAVISIQRDGRGGNLHGHICINSIDMITGKSLRGDKKHHNYIKNKSDEIQRQLNILNKNELNDEYTDKQTIQEIKAREKGQYIWKDDIKSRIENCMENPNILSYEEFKQEMKNQYNVDITERKTKKEDVYGGYVLTYTFNDKNNKKRKVRSTRLGSTYGLKGIDYGIKTNQQQRQTVATNTTFTPSTIEHDEREYEYKPRINKSNSVTKQESRDFSHEVGQLKQRYEDDRQRELEKTRHRQHIRELERTRESLERQYREKQKSKQYGRSL